MSRAANIQKRGARYRVRWYNAAGKRQSKSFTREKDARAHLAKVTAQRDAEREGTVRRRVAGTLNAVYEEWLETRPPARRRDDRSRLEHHILPALGHKRLSEIDPATVQRFIRGLERTHTARKGETNKAKRTLRPATINNVLITLRKLLNDHDYPIRVRYKVPLGEHTWIRDPADVDAFLDACEAGSGEWFKVAAAIGVYAGLRKGEIAGLRIDALDFGRKLIRVDRSYDGPTKSRHMRFVPMAPELADILRRWIWDRGNIGGIKRRPGDLVVTVPTVGPITEPYDLARKARRASKRAGLTESINFHGTRHTAGSHMAEVVSLAVVGAVLGHADPKTTSRYAHLSTEHVSQDARLQLSYGAVDAKVVAMPPGKKSR